MPSLQLAGYTLADATARLTSAYGSYELISLSEIDVDPQREKSYGTGTSRRPVSVGRGSEQGSGSMTLELGEIPQLLKAFTGGQIVFTDLTSLPPMKLVIVYENDEGDSVTSTVYNLEFTGGGFNVGSGSEPAKKSFPFICTHQKTI